MMMIEFVYSHHYHKDLIISTITLKCDLSKKAFEKQISNAFFDKVLSCPEIAIQANTTQNLPF